MGRDRCGGFHLTQVTFAIATLQTSRAGQLNENIRNSPDSDDRGNGQVKIINSTNSV
jgi:hypothetical protein